MALTTGAKYVCSPSSIIYWFCYLQSHRDKMYMYVYKSIYWTLIDKLKGEVSPNNNVNWMVESKFRNPTVIFFSKFG